MNIYLFIYFEIFEIIICIKYGHFEKWRVLRVIFS